MSRTPHSRPIRHVLLTAVSAAALTAFAASQARASCDTWTAGGNGNWSDNSDWNGGTPDSPTTSVCITDGTSTVTLDAPGETAIDDLDIGAGNELDVSGVGSDVTLTVTGSSIENNGEIDLQGLSGGAVLDTGATISGNGTILVGGGANLTMYGGANAGNTIEVEGGIFAPGLSATNDSGGTILLEEGELAAGNFMNEGLIKVVSGDSNLLFGDVINSGSGSIELENAGLVLGGTGGTGSIQGGTVDGVGALSLGGGLLDNVTLGSGIITDAGGSLLEGTITNNGEIGTGGGNVNFLGNVTLAGDGTTLVSGGSVLNDQLEGPATLYNAGNTIFGYGTPGNAATIVNLVNESGGTVIAENTGGALVLAGTTTNAGRIQVMNGAEIDATGSFANGGQVLIGANGMFTTGSNDYNQSAGTTQVDGTLTAGNANVNGSALTGTGTVMADLFNYGTVRPGDPGSFGTLSVTGSFTQGSTGTLEIDIAGKNPGQYSQLDVSGQTSLAGTLALVLLNGFALTKGQSFDIVDTGSFSGDFTSLALDGGSCSMAGTENWTCGNVSLSEVFVSGDQLYIDVNAPNAVPEPDSLVLLLGGGLALAGAGMLRRKKHFAR
jgi:hypothetical protein